MLKILKYYNYGIFFYILVHLYNLTFNPMKADLFAMIDSNGPQTGWIKWVEK